MVGSRYNLFQRQITTMGYSQITVVLGGLVHIPILIGILWVFDKRTSQGYEAQKAIEAQEKAKAEAEAAEKAAAEKAAAEKAAAEKAAAKAKAEAAAKKEAEAKAKAQAEAEAENNNEEN